MSTLEIDGLRQLLEGFSVSDLSADVLQSSLLTNPLDVWRSALATLLTGLVDCEVLNAYKAIQWPNNIFNGDLSVTLPRLSPGSKVAELSSEIVNKGKHLRSTIIGGFIGRLYESIGWDVTRINYLGDWGKPIALLYVGWTKFGSQEAYDADPVGHLLEVYHQIDGLFQPEHAASRQARDDAAKEGKDEGEAQAEIEGKGIFAERNEAFKKLEDGDEEVKAFWNRIRSVIVEDYARFYERLGVRFDEYSGESQVNAETMAEVEQLLKDKKLSEESAGAWVVDMKNLKVKAGHAIIRDRTGSSTYLLRDLAAVLERSRKYAFDEMIYVVASDNSVHFSQLRKIMEAIDPELEKKLRHVKFSESSKMATALGKGYKPQTILDRCEEAVAAFPETDSEKGHTTTTTLSDEDLEALTDEDQVNLLRLLAQYPEVVNATFPSLEPSAIVLYIASVTDQLSEVLDEEGEIIVTPGLAALLEATRIVLENGMKLLGLVPVAEKAQERADTPIAA
ncbi:arginyl-tRNA synthetase [Ophiobolus disseminans]|uniref:arginine--tRNA ligase n=1 Tax=Ophiobolus disseminans TaxID=1469910 RepID=A0A6A7AH58_9PLEO|nr:arginyl-tRNA synthetase [Ophiobolus disseminans]